MIKRLIPVLFLLFISTSFAQVELVPVSSPVYDFFLRMKTQEILPDYNPAVIPVSRETAADNLRIISAKSSKLSSVDKKLFRDFEVEFSYDLTGTLGKRASLFKTTRYIFSDDRQKDLYGYADSNVTLFLDGLAGLSQRESRGDSLGRHSITLGELGFRIRGTMYNSVAYYLRASNGQKISGDSGDVRFARNTDPRLFAQYKFEYEQNNFDTFEGYLRYRTNGNWLGLMVGRNPVYMGTGFTDRLFLSNNTVPFDFLKLDLAYKAVAYSFIYGSLRGDSLGRGLDAKNIATHRIDVRFSNAFQMGFFESVISADNPFSFTFLNPVSFLTSAELSKSSQEGENNDNNSIMGFDMLVIPVKSLALQASLLIDDLDFSTLFKDNSQITNKFAWQLGVLWENAFTLPNLRLRAEYTRLDPFVYSHVSNKTQYTHWDLPLGHHLEPNSDEIAVGVDYDITNRLKLKLLYQHQRSANGIVVDSLGRVVVNYGGQIDNASGYSFSDPEFLKGNRVNRDILKFNVNWQFLRQFYIDVVYVHRIFDNVFENKKLKDDYGFVSLIIDY